MASNPQSHPDEDLLLPFERHALRDPFKEFVRVKRTNRFATIQRFPRYWEHFELIDKIWLREIEDLKQAIEPSHLVVTPLFIRAFARIRVAMPVAFEGCITEAVDLLRGAIESVAQAHRILRDSGLAAVWLTKDDNKENMHAYKVAFEKGKRENLFKGLPRLHYHWSQFSEWGHSNVASVMSRIEGADCSDGEVDGSFQFFECNPQKLVLALDIVFDAVRGMEQVLFSGFGTRLNLDIELVRMRATLPPKLRRSSTRS